MDSDIDPAEFFRDYSDPEYSSFFVCLACFVWFWFGFEFLNFFCPLPRIYGNAMPSLQLLGLEKKLQPVRAHHLVFSLPSAKNSWK